LGKSTSSSIWPHWMMGLDGFIVSWPDLGHMYGFVHGLSGQGFFASRGSRSGVGD
jgi:hypothetical protein